MWVVIALILLSAPSLVAAQPTCGSDPAVLRPHDVQGSQHFSSREGETVTVEGLATRASGRFLYINVRISSAVPGLLCF